MTTPQHRDAPPAAGRDLDALVAALLGIAVEWRWFHWSYDVPLSSAERPEEGSDAYHPSMTYQPCYRRSSPDPEFEYGDAFDYNPILSYSTDIAAAWQVEERMREYDQVYTDALIVVVLGADGLVRHDMRGLYSDQVFRLVHATPHQRCLAALKAVAPPAPTLGRDEHGDMR